MAPSVIILMVVTGSWYIHMTGLIRFYNLLFFEDESLMNSSRERLSEFQNGRINH